MKKVVLMFSMFIVSLGYSQNTAFDDFFSKNPLDFSLGGFGSKYEITRLDDSKVTGVGIAGIGFGLGWRYSLLHKGAFAFFPRVGLEGSYYGGENTKKIKYSAFCFQTPLTLNIALGTGGHRDYDARFGVQFGAGYTTSIFSYSRTYPEAKYSNTTFDFSPYAYMIFKIKTNDDFTWGIKPSVTLRDKNPIFGCHLYFDVIYD